MLLSSIRKIIWAVQKLRGLSSKCAICRTFAVFAQKIGQPDSDCPILIIFICKLLLIQLVKIRTLLMEITQITVGNIVTNLFVLSIANRLLGLLRQKLQTGLN